MHIPTECKWVSLVWRTLNYLHVYETWQLWVTYRSYHSTTVLSIYWCPTRFPYQMIFVSFDSDCGAGTDDHSRASEFTSFFSGVHVARSLVFWVMFCRSLYVLLSFFVWSLCCLPFNLRLLITPLVCSNFSYCLHGNSFSLCKNLQYCPLDYIYWKYSSIFDIKVYSNLYFIIVSVRKIAGLHITYYG